jgi:hypothetical protein
LTRIKKLWHNKSRRNIMTKNKTVNEIELKKLKYRKRTVLLMATLIGFIGLGTVSTGCDADPIPEKELYPDLGTGVVRIENHTTQTNAHWNVETDIHGKTLVYRIDKAINYIKTNYTSETAKLNSFNSVKVFLVESGEPSFVIFNGGLIINFNVDVNWIDPDSNAYSNVNVRILIRASINAVP